MGRVVGFPDSLLIFNYCSLSAGECMTNPNHGWLLLFGTVSYGVRYYCYIALWEVYKIV